jgi:ABC-2 type transport system permease protein
MLDTLRLYGRYLDISIRSQLQYRAATVMQAAGQLLVTAIEFFGIWALFARFGSLRGWTLPEVGLLYGIVHTAWALTDAAGRGFDLFGTMVRQGDFDRLLLRPRSTVLQIAGQELTLRRFGRFVQGAVVLCWALTALHVAITPAKVLLLVAAILGGACLFYGLLIVQATVAFWTVETLEIFNCLSYGGVFAGQYPVSIYRGWFRRLLTVGFPLAAIAYFPALAITGHADPLGTSRLFQCCAPLLGLAFLLIALQVWKIGVRHYCSTGS